MSRRELWTKASVECWDNNCTCSSKCPNYEVCQKVVKDYNLKEPPIKKVVETLLENDIAIPLVYSDLDIHCLTHYEAEILHNFLHQDEISKEKSLLVLYYGIADKFEDFLDEYKYRCHERNKLVLFKSWAKKNLKKELDEYIRIGVN